MDSLCTSTIFFTPIQGLTINVTLFLIIVNVFEILVVYCGYSILR